MHRLHSKSAIFRFRIVALLICLQCVLLPSSLAVLAYSVIVHNDPLTLAALGGVLMSAILIVLQWMLGARTHCPLCMTPVMALKNCVKHRHARTLLGSHRLRVALAVIFRNSFRCQYCNEPTVLEVRTRSHYRAHSGS